jgi:potassium-dependent mechanosensitive channel
VLSPSIHYWMTPTLARDSHTAKWVRPSLVRILVWTILGFAGASAQTLLTGPVPQTTANSAKTTETAAPSNPTPSDSAIPLAQIADRAEQLDRLLREISNQLTHSPELREAQRLAEARGDELRQRALQVDDLLGATPTSLELDDEQRYWRSRSIEYGVQRKLMTAYAAKIEQQVRVLDQQQAIWQTTWDEVKATKGIETLLERIRQEVDAIQGSRAAAQEQLNLVLTLQNEVSQYDQQISEMLFHLREAADRQRGRLLEQDSRFLWEVPRPHKFDQPLWWGIHRSFARSFTRLWEFLGFHKAGALGLFVFYLLILVAVMKLRHYVEREMEDVGPEVKGVLACPYSVALLGVLLSSAHYLALAPIGIATIICLLYTIPVMRLLLPLIQRAQRIQLYLLSAFYAVAGLYLLIQLPSVLRRDLFAFIIFAALVSLGWFTRPSSMRGSSLLPRSLRLLNLVIRANLALLAASLVSNILGFFALAQLLGLTVLLGAFGAVTLYCTVRVANLVIGVLLRSDWARSLPELPVAKVERWTSRALALFASSLWVILVLRLLTIYDAVIGSIASALRYSIGYERVSFTLAGVFSVIVIVVVGYAFARAFTFLLKKFLLPKLPLQRGVPLAVSTVTYYCLLILVAVAALANAGVDLNKFTVLTGAIGVGLGFGLQNIVNNFVSGLILLFERPIHVGDVIDVGGLVGTVKRIGARSSTVLTFQGAEVIVPNSNLLSNQVINWTLSSEWRRVDIPVGVAYGTEPERVMNLLVGVAKSHPGVLLDRPPMAFFMGFGESALNFELRFWSAAQDTWFQLQSDITVAIAKAMEQAGIEIPFPQRDLHLRSIDVALTERLADQRPVATSSAYGISKTAGL